MGVWLYHLPTARFLQPDPLGHASDMSLYSYANGDPVNFVDPTGRLTMILHGTFDKDAQWINTNAEMANSLRDQGVHDVWKGVNQGDEFRWSGGNSHKDRIQAAKDLVIWTERWRANNDPAGMEPINIIAHSHGGNVATLATQYGLKINTLITLGTPHESLQVGNNLIDGGRAASNSLNPPREINEFFNSIVYPYAPREDGIKTWVNVYDQNDKVQTGYASLIGTSGYLTAIPNSYAVPSSTKLINMNLTGVSGSSLSGIQQHSLLASPSTTNFYSTFLNARTKSGYEK